MLLYVVTRTSSNWYCGVFVSFDEARRYVEERIGQQEWRWLGSTAYHVDYEMRWSMSEDYYEIHVEFVQIARPSLPQERVIDVFLLERIKDALSSHFDFVDVKVSTSVSGARLVVEVEQKGYRALYAYPYDDQLRPARVIGEVLADYHAYIAELL